MAGNCLQDHGNLLAIDLLAPESCERYLRDPSQLERDILARGTRGLLVFVDEIQKLPGLLDVVHRLYERHRIQFLLTGSSARKLKRGGANLLAGRLLGLRLHPLTCRELDLPDEQALQFGSLPGVTVGNPAPDATLRAYVHLYLKEEILEEALVRKTAAFSRFIELAGQYHGEPVNASRIARLAGVSPNTVQEYYQILEDTLMVHRLPGWSASVGKQLRSASKYFLFDNGVANALKGELRVESGQRTSRFGKLFESRVIQEAFWLNDYRELDLKLSYWQTSTGQEVDLIVSRGAGPPLAGLEIKSDTAPDRARLERPESISARAPGCGVLLPVPLASSLPRPGPSRGAPLETGARGPRGPVDLVPRVIGGSWHVRAESILPSQTHLQPRYGGHREEVEIAQSLGLS